MSDRPGVAFVVHEMRAGGAEIFVRALIERLRDRLRPVVICLDAVGALGRELEHHDVPVVCVDRRPGFDPGCGRRIARTCAAHRIDIVHAQQYTAFFYSAIGRMFFGGRYQIVLTEHGRPSPDEISTRRRLVNRWVLSRQATAVTACSDFSRRGLALDDGFGRADIDVIRNGVPVPDDTTPAPTGEQKTRAGFDLDRRHALIAARLAPVKDHPTMLKAFSVLASQLEDVSLVIAGDGPLRSDLERHTTDLGLDDRVRWLGVRSDVPDLMAASDLVVLSSRTEAAPLALLEGMAASRPVVATAVGGIPELVTNGVEGLLVPADDPTALAEAMKRILEDQGLGERLGAAGRRRVLRDHRVERVVDDYEHLYTELLGGTAGR